MKQIKDKSKHLLDYKHIYLERTNWLNGYFVCGVKMFVLTPARMDQLEFKIMA